MIFSANQDLSREKCGADCMIVTGTHVPEYGKLTSIPISGVQPQMEPGSRHVLFRHVAGVLWV